MVVSDEKPVVESANEKFVHEVQEAKDWKTRINDWEDTVTHRLVAGGIEVIAGGHLSRTPLVEEPWVQDQFDAFFRFMRASDNRGKRQAAHPSEASPEGMRDACLAQLADDLMDLAEAAREVWGSAR